MALSYFLNVIQQYSGASASSPPASTQEDFSKVAETAPQSHLAGELAEAFRSDQTPPFAEMVGNLFRQSNGQQRAGILTQLLSSSGGNPLSGLGEHFSGLLKPGSQITPQQAEQIPPEAFSNWPNTPRRIIRQFWIRRATSMPNIRNLYKG